MSDPIEKLEHLIIYDMFNHGYPHIYERRVNSHEGLSTDQLYVAATPGLERIRLETTRTLQFHLPVYSIMEGDPMFFKPQFPSMVPETELPIRKLIATELRNQLMTFEELRQHLGIPKLNRSISVESTHCIPINKERFEQRYFALHNLFDM